jgi:hypothetical protein
MEQQISLNNLLKEGENVMVSINTETELSVDMPPVVLEVLMLNWELEEYSYKCNQISNC